MLEINDLHAHYGKSHVLTGFGMTLQKGEMVCLLGRNGVGKTTLLRCLMGLVPVTWGLDLSGVCMHS